MNGLVCLCSDIALDFSPKPMGVCFSRSSRENFFALSLGPKVQSASFVFLQPLCLFTALNSLWNSPAQDAGMSTTVEVPFCDHLKYVVCVTYYRKASLTAQILQAIQGGLLYFGFRSLFPQESSKCKCNPCFFLFC